MTKRERAKRFKAIAIDLTRIKAELGELEMWQTMHAMDHPLYALGWDGDPRLQTALVKRIGEVTP